MAIRVFPVAAEGSPHYVDDFSFVPPGKTIVEFLEMPSPQESLKK